MNNRDYKNFASGAFYHIYNRGTAKMDIFKDDEDYFLFLGRLRENLYPQLTSSRSRKNPYKRKLLPPDSFDLVAYCLMPNHFHLLVRQNSEVSISKLMSKICTSYSMCFNKKYERVGTLFQDQFKAVRIDSNQQLGTVFSYIHNNPLRAGIVSDPVSYAYSSYADYFLDKDNSICKCKEYLFLV